MFKINEYLNQSMKVLLNCLTLQSIQYNVEESNGLHAYIVAL